MDNSSPTKPEPITIAEQGSFFVGGRKLIGDGVFDPSDKDVTNKGAIFWVDQMYVQYQIPVNPRKYPIVFVHGGAGTGRVWETTPDGREGFQSIFLRRGFPVYIVDAPRRGRSGYPSFNGPVGDLDGQHRLPNSRRIGLQYAWVMWRFGPQYPDVFPVQQFPMDSMDSFARHLVPDVKDPILVVDALEKLLERIGPAILVTHSESGIYGWQTALRTRNVVGVVSYEPGFGLLFPESAVPDPIPFHQGDQAAGVPVSKADFANLAAIPIQVVYGDNIPSKPVANFAADGRRAQREAGHLFVNTLNGHDGYAELLSLPNAGLFGNSHFMFSDLNNVAVADRLSAFLRDNKLDLR